MLTDIEIAQQAKMLKIKDVAEKLGISLKAVSVRSFRLRKKIKKLAEAVFSAILMLFMNFTF